METLTEHRPVHRPVVYGYLRLAGASLTRGTVLAVALADTYGVVLPTAFHLGFRSTAVERERQIMRAGVRLLLVRPRHRTPVAGIPN